MHSSNNCLAMIPKMKKIKNIKQLKEQKAILAARQLQAEKNVRLHWKNLIEELYPSKLAAEAIDRISHSATANTSNEGSVIKRTITYGLSLLAHKLAGMAEEKLKQVFSK